MPAWADVLKEIQMDEMNASGSLDRVRTKYLQQLNVLTGRNVIAYYSGWLQNPDHAMCFISDVDKNGLMETVHKLDRGRGLDVLLHTPGGDLAATESLVDYLHRMFGGDIRCFIPQLAMSVGTMIACACREIFMGKQSNIGPIDPQFGGVPAVGILNEFEEAIARVQKEPGCWPVWQTIIGKYHPTLIGECRNAIEMAGIIVKDWLLKGMLADDENAGETADRIVRKLNNRDGTELHARHIHAEEARSLGLKITMLEENDCLQDVVLTIHHAYMHTFANTDAIKIVENHMGRAMVLTLRAK